VLRPKHVEAETAEEALELLRFGQGVVATLARCSRRLTLQLGSASIPGDTRE